MTPEFDADTAAAGTGLAGLLMAGKWLLDRLAGGWRKIRAEARAAEVAADVAASAEWKSIVADLRAEIARRDDHCDEKLEALQSQVDKLRTALHARDRIIVALARNRRLNAEERALLLDIASDAEPEPKEHHT